MFDRVFGRFVLVGIGNTLAGLGGIFTAKLAFNDFAANLIGSLIVLPLSFVAHRDVSFQHTGSRLAAFGRYLPTVLMGYLSNLCVLTVGLSIGSNAYLTQTAAIACHVGVTYLLSRFFVFKESHGT